MILENTKALPRIHVIYPYYDNPMMLAAHLINWNSYPQGLIDKLHFIIVDDCSKTMKAKEIIQESELPITLYEILTDIPWNQHGAKNLAMWDFKENSQREWCLLTDMDIVFTSEDMYRLMNQPIEPSHHYTFERLKMPNREEKKYHPNTILVRSDKYWEIGGYDEDFCGTYGGDGPFHKALKQVTCWSHLKDVYCHYYGRTYITDSGTNDLDRREHYNKLYREVWEQKRKEKNMVPKNHLRFKWEKIR